MVKEIIWDMFTDKGIRRNNEDSIGVGYVCDVDGDRVIFCVKCKCGDDDFEEYKINLIIRDGNLILSNGKKLNVKGKISSFYVFAVADGLGGHQMGEVASEWAIRSFISIVFYNYILTGNLKESIKSAYLDAEDIVMEQSSKNSGTTLVSFIVANGKYAFGNIGDSRGYLLSRGSGVTFRTKDHSFVQGLIDMGAITEEEAKDHPQRNILLKALGMKKGGPDVVYVNDRKFEYFLLCSDGFSNVFSDEEIYEMVIKELSAKELVKRGIERGSDDNVSVIWGRIMH